MLYFDEDFGEDFAEDFAEDFGLDAKDLKALNEFDDTPPVISDKEMASMNAMMASELDEPIEAELDEPIEADVDEPIEPEVEEFKDIQPEVQEVVLQPIESTKADNGQMAFVF